ncbi:hypothetical protein V6N11_011538 [Hibiscus sabdariffa]|uniref:Uncharacterized protein n=1 Tax=Hibiscus sabdariffa TaxID=183260 RepID=A0ABR2S8P2_9ROSI
MFMKNNHPFFRKPPPSTEAAVFLSLRPPSPNSDRSLRPPETQKTFFLKPSSFNFLTILLTATSLEGVLSLSESLGRQQTADLNVFEESLFNFLTILITARRGSFIVGNPRTTADLNVFEGVIISLSLYLLLLVVVVTRILGGKGRKPLHLLDYFVELSLTICWRYEAQTNTLPIKNRTLLFKDILLFYFLIHRLEHSWPEITLPCDTQQLSMATRNTSAISLACVWLQWSGWQWQEECTLLFH